MSLELELQRCTAALEALTAVLGKTAIFPVIDTAPAPAEVAPPKPQAAPVVAPASTMSATTPASGTPEVTPTIEYAAVAKAITDVFKVDRAKVIEVLAKFGAAKGPQLKPADYAAFLKELAA
jgi:hypothetical protein